MKIKVQTGVNLRVHLAEQLDLALALLDQEATRDLLRRLRQLIKTIKNHASPALVEGLTPRELADLLKQLLYFIEARPERGEAQILPSGLAGQMLLLVCAPDVPFLFDSILTFLKRRDVRFRVFAHPVLNTRKGVNGRRLSSGRGHNAQADSFILIALKGVVEKQLGPLLVRIQEQLYAMQLLEEDRTVMEKQLTHLTGIATKQQFHHFWKWLHEGNFQPVSYRAIEVRRDNQGVWICQEPGSALGMSTHWRELSCCEDREAVDTNIQFGEQLLRSGPVVVAHTERPSPFHWDEKLFYIGLREPGENSWCEHAFLGVFTRQSSLQQSSDVPALRRRIARALHDLAIRTDSHDYRKTFELLDSFPKTELFFMSQSELQQVVRSFTILYRYETVRVVAVPSLAVEGLTLVVMMPRDFYSRDSLSRMETYLRRCCYSDAVDVRVMQILSDYVTLHVSLAPPREEVRLDLSQLQRGLSRIGQPWHSKLRQLLEKEYGLYEGGKLWRRYQNAFCREYLTLVHPRFALRDLKAIEQLLTDGQEHFALWGPFAALKGFCRLQYYSLQETYLNELMPILENFGLAVVEEMDFEVAAEGRVVFIKSFTVRRYDNSAGPLGHEIRELLMDALRAVRRKMVANDRLHCLLLSCGLSWRQVDVFRCYIHYTIQLGSPYGQALLVAALVDNPQVVLLLNRYFTVRFSNGEKTEASLEKEELLLPPLRHELTVALKQVKDINQDRILRSLFNLIDATVRTNFFRSDAEQHPLAIKLDTLGILDLEHPRSRFEIYVHSATMEGIHLRGGKISRGGIRWSERLDLRNEILGLMKTQMTKNALIVPTGSKGGFRVKTPFLDRSEGVTLADVAYRDFMTALLDVTDNRVGGEVVHPPRVVVYDGDDPYLVVAADKGTSHLPDTANAIAENYGYWLGDAFASGGSHGYDHKKLGITARGAWVSVQRHFRETGVDIQRQPITVIGIGDMGGDVFGNGMLCSRQIHLLGAFNHRHIFIDPDPDVGRSFAERQRLYNLRLGWDEYNPELISSGGGVFSRSAKDIPLSDEIRRWLGVSHASTDGPGLIRLLLTAPADLLWNGGIGTYVKSGSETHQQVNDRINDRVRVDAQQLRVPVVGEGGNLGFTQQARIDYALAGGRINTDGIDNAGGVVCSDHEVNIKILLLQLQEQGVLGCCEERDKLLEDLTEAVSEAVLADCYGQSLCLSLDKQRCEDDPAPFMALIEHLVNTGLLDRQSESLPTMEKLQTRGFKSLTRPELSVLLAYSKLYLVQKLLNSSLPKRSVGQQYLVAYFPQLLQDRFPDLLVNHPLAPEIAATAITNALINQAGCTFVYRLTEMTGAATADLVSVYLAFDLLLEGASLRRQITALDNRLPAFEQYGLLHRLESCLEALCRWSLLQDMAVVPEEPSFGTLARDLETFITIQQQLLPAATRQEIATEQRRLRDMGLSEDHAWRVVLLPRLRHFLPVVVLADKIGQDLDAAARLYADVGNFLELATLERRLQQVPVSSSWDRLARRTLLDKFAELGFSLPLAVWNKNAGDQSAFFGARQSYLANYRQLLDGIREGALSSYNVFTGLAGMLEALLH
jgi:glutamate dehydrogenase